MPYRFDTLFIFAACRRMLRFIFISLFRFRRRCRRCRYYAIRDAALMSLLIPALTNTTTATLHAYAAIISMRYASNTNATADYAIDSC